MQTFDMQTFDKVINKTQFIIHKNQKLTSKLFRSQINI